MLGCVHTLFLSRKPCIITHAWPINSNVTMCVVFRLIFYLLEATAKLSIFRAMCIMIIAMLQDVVTTRCSSVKERCRMGSVGYTTGLRNVSEKQIQDCRHLCLDPPSHHSTLLSSSCRFVWFKTLFFPTLLISYLSVLDWNSMAAASIMTIAVFPSWLYRIDFVYRPSCYVFFPYHTFLWTH